MSEPVKGGGPLFLGDQRQKGRVGAPPYFVASLIFYNHFMEIILDGFPTCLEESGHKPIKAWGFFKIHTCKDPFDFFFRDRGHEVSINRAVNQILNQI